MKVFVPVFACLVAFAAANINDETFVRREFQLFEQKFSKHYRSGAERENRFQVFKDNLANIQKHNLAGTTWEQGVNKFADMTEAEFQSTLSGYVNTYKESAPLTKERSHIDLSQLPENVDWRDAGVVTPAKDQGACGSCWAFATVEMIESYAALNNGSLVELSTQQITSCTPNELQCGGTGGCQGSIPQLGFMYTQLFGVTAESNWPYTSGNFGQTGDCAYDPEAQTPSAYVRGYEVLPRNDYATVMDHIANIGPLSIAVDASGWSFYRGGVFDGCPVDQNIQINHAVQLVGYGTDADEGDYWLVRNSWGGSWGEDGYIRLRRRSDPECGTDSTPLMGTACVNDGNEVQYVCGTCALLFDIAYPIGTYLV